jgi:hypothetical protein
LSYRARLIKLGGHCSAAVPQRIRLANPPSAYLFSNGERRKAQRQSMPVYHYFLSANPTDPAPNGAALSSIEADTPAAALALLHHEGRLPANWRLLWAHFLIWVDQEGKQRGFESIQLSQWTPATGDVSA